MALTMATSSIARRKTSDITRLSSQYQSSMQSLTADYEKSFGEYQSQVNAQMIPYQEALNKYKTEDMTAYDEAKAAYQQKLDVYMNQLKELEADPVTSRTVNERVGRTWYGKGIYRDVTYYDPKPIPTFDAKQPDLPNAPTMPTVQAFDDSAYSTKRQQLQSDLQRELGERKAARIGAVSRKSTRPLLQGVSG